MELIDRDEAIKRLGDAHFKNYGNAIMVIRETLPVDAIPVSYIQDRIYSLQSLSEYEFEANGGYIGSTHTEIHALKSLIKDWRAEQEKQNGNSE